MCASTSVPVGETALIEEQREKEEVFVSVCACISVCVCSIDVAVLSPDLSSISPDFKQTATTLHSRRGGRKRE